MSFSVPSPSTRNTPGSTSSVTRSTPGRRSECVVVGVSRSASSGSANLLCSLSKDLVARGLRAGDIIKAAAKHIGGGGGGRPDLAQAGGKNPAGLDAALDAGVDDLKTKLEATA